MNRISPNRPVLGRTLNIGAIAVIALVASPLWADTSTFSFTGANQTYTVPEGVTLISVKMWGAGGGASTGGADGGYTTNKRLHEHEPDELKASLKSEPS